MPSRSDRWSQYDETSYRTGGMERVGYDADTQVSYFQQGGQLYEGQPGSEFGGELRHIGAAPPRQQMDIATEAPTSGWRQLAPFLLIIGVVMLLLLKYFSSFSPVVSPAPPGCPDGLVSYKVASGDSCWSIADQRGWSLDDLNEANPRLRCDPLLPGTLLCVPS